MSELLRKFTTMKIGGTAEKIIRLNDLSELKAPLPQPIRILGNGSNILIDDQGLKGTVIVVRDFPRTDPEILQMDSNTTTVKVSAGIFLPTLCRWAERKRLSGCEYMIGVPGTLGGAIVQNAGAQEQDISMILEEAEVFNVKTQCLQKISAADLGLSYRHSNLKEDPSKLVVRANLVLKNDVSEAISSRIQKNLDYRKQKTPYQRPSLGSVFTRLQQPDGSWLFPGKLVEEAGLKGFRIGGAQISPVHGNYITNEDNATYDDVMNIIRHIEVEVKKRTGFTLQREILVWSDRISNQK